MKNTCAKTRSVTAPYEIWTNNSGWEWRVLKKYQTPEKEAKNPYARWFCAVKSPLTFGSWEFGDTYVNDVTKYAVKVQSITQELKPDWCKCGRDACGIIFFGNGQCKCGVHKHHYHCEACGHICQVG